MVDDEMRKIGPFDSKSYQVTFNYYFNTRIQRGRTPGHVIQDDRFFPHVYCGYPSCLKQLPHPRWLTRLHTAETYLS